MLVEEVYENENSVFKFWCVFGVFLVTSFLCVILIVHRPNWLNFSMMCFYHILVCHSRYPLIWNLNKMNLIWFDILIPWYVGNFKIWIKKLKFLKIEFNFLFDAINTDEKKLLNFWIKSKVRTRLELLWKKLMNVLLKYLF